MKIWKFLFGNNFSYLDLVGIMFLTSFYKDLNWPSWVYWVSIIVWILSIAFVGGFIRAHLEWKQYKPRNY